MDLLILKGKFTYVFYPNINWYPLFKIANYMLKYVFLMNIINLKIIHKMTRNLQ